MLTTYRRHKKDCEHRNEGRKYRRCKCPIWIDGFLAGKEIRKSLGPNVTWEEAQKTIRDWEADGKQAALPSTELPMIADVCDEFIEDAQARNLKDRTIYKYRLLFEQLKNFAADHGIRFLKELDPPTVRKFRASWKDHNLAAVKKLERLRGFFRLAIANGRITENPAAKIKSPKFDQRPTLPFSHDEMVRILGFAAKRAQECQSHGKDNARRLRALVMLLRYSGLRIGDAVGCPVERLTNGKLRLYTQKTGTHVHCPLPDFVVTELDAIPRMSERFWFWTGNGKLQTAVTDWQGRLQQVFKEAKIVGGHAHRFRHTYAVQLLLAGVPIERVAVFLGHSSIKVTEKFYSPWIRERQEQAEADVRRTWAEDPVALLETKGTPQVHGKREAVN
jgi:integrase/recombinase XerD